MFNRKKKQIEYLKNNVKMLNEKRIELSSANYAYQVAIQNMERKIDEIYELVKPKKKVTKKTEVKKPVTKKKEAKKSGK